MESLICYFFLVLPYWPKWKKYIIIYIDQFIQFEI